MEYYYLVTFFDTHDPQDLYHGGFTTCVTTSERIEDPDSVRAMMDQLREDFNVKGMVIITMFHYLGCRSKWEE